MAQLQDTKAVDGRSSIRSKGASGEFFRRIHLGNSCCPSRRARSGNIGDSLHALIENPSPQAMRILDQIKGQWVVILIDMGNTPNFWDSSNLSKMHLPLSTGQGFETKID